MTKIKRFLLLLSLPAFALVLAGCGSQQKPQSSTGVLTPQTTPQATSNNAPGQTQAQAPAANDNAASIAAQREGQLPALPSNNKQAIDSEINSINKDISTTDNTTSSTDLSSANLGL